MYRAPLSKQPASSWAVGLVCLWVGFLLWGPFGAAYQFAGGLYVITRAGLATWASRFQMSWFWSGIGYP